MEGGINFQSDTQSGEEKKGSASSCFRHTALWLVGTFFSLFFFQACKEDKKATAPPIRNRDSMAVLQTEGVTSLISDSGIIKYRIRTKSWDMYDRTEVPHWRFEKGLLVEQFDRNHKVNATIQSDTAYYYTLTKIWDLRGNVQIKNVRGDKFFTSQLFWDQNAERVYSDRKIRIEQSDKIINGTSFESNQDMTKYTIHNTVGEVSFDEEKLQKKPASDTLQTPS